MMRGAACLTNWESGGRSLAALQLYNLNYAYAAALVYLGQCFEVMGR